ncbi:MAG: hypothetical protein ACFWT2_12300 [Thermoanaerobacterium thermosaccharolyticum]|jgi:hypothetical protein
MIRKITVITVIILLLITSILSVFTVSNSVANSNITVMQAVSSPDNSVVEIPSISQRR